MRKHEPKQAARAVRHMAAVARREKRRGKHSSRVARWRKRQVRNG